MDGTSAGVAAEGEGTAAPTDQESRDASMHETMTAWGPTGLLHTPSALTREAGTFAVGLMIDWFKVSGFLCTAEHPCNNGTSTSDTASHIGAVAGVSATLIPGLEAYGTGRVYANSNDQGKPQLLQVLGDLTLGLKFVKPLGSGVMNVGGGAEAIFLNGTGGIGLSGQGTSFRLRGLFTAALDKNGGPPLRFHLGLGYYFDNSGKVVSDVEDARTARLGSRQVISRIERYGLGINKVDRFEIGFGPEYMLAKDKVRLFAEYTMWLPVNRQSYECPKPGDITVQGGGTGRSDECLAEQGFSYLPSKVTLGAKFFPFDGGMKGLSFLTAFDLGVTGTSKFISEVAPQAPWTLWLGVGLTADSNEPAPKIVEKSVEKIKEVQVGTALVHVKGFVHETGTNTPIPNAIVSYPTGGIMPVATGADGIFGDDVPPGAYQFSIKADGYKDGVCGGNALAAAAPGAAPVPPPPPVPGAPLKPPTPGVLEVDCALEALPKVGSVSVSIIDVEGGAPIAGIAVTVTDAAGSNPKSFTSDGNGVVRIEAFIPGMYFATIDAEGFFATKGTFEVKVREDLKATVSLRPRPKDKLVTIDKTEVKIKQQVHFATDKATILGDSIGLLEEIADVLIHTPRLKKIEIQGHTDNTGTPEHNMQLSIDRAEAVRKFLVDHGVEASRIESKGFGDKKPISPNINEAGKAKNRRVQFLIVDQDAPPPDPKAKPKK